MNLEKIKSSKNKTSMEKSVRGIFRYLNTSKNIFDILLSLTLSFTIPFTPNILIKGISMNIPIPWVIPVITE